LCHKKLLLPQYLFLVAYQEWVLAHCHLLNNQIRHELPGLASPPDRVLVQSAGVAPLQGSRFSDEGLKRRATAPGFMFSTVDHHSSLGKLGTLRSVRDDAINQMGDWQWVIGNE
jgi:hypothetical protein